MLGWVKLPLVLEGILPLPFKTFKGAVRAIFMEVIRSCIHVNTCSLVMEFFNLQVCNYVMSSNKGQVV